MTQPKIGIVVAEFYADLAQTMLLAAQEAAAQHELSIAVIVRVPGSLEIPLAVSKLLAKPDIVGVACIGAVIKGETDHDQVVAHTTARKLVDLSVQYQKPVGIGISGPNQTHAQALARAKPFGQKAVEVIAHMRKALENL